MKFYGSAYRIYYDKYIKYDLLFAEGEFCFMTFFWKVINKNNPTKLAESPPSVWWINPVRNIKTISLSSLRLCGEL